MLESFYNSCRSGAIYSLLPILNYSDALSELKLKKPYTVYILEKYISLLQFTKNILVLDKENVNETQTIICRILTTYWKNMYLYKKLNKKWRKSQQKTWITKGLQVSIKLGEKPLRSRRVWGNSVSPPQRGPGAKPWEFLAILHSE